LRPAGRRARLYVLRRALRAASECRPSGDLVIKTLTRAVLLAPSATAPSHACPAITVTLHPGSSYLTSMHGRTPQAPVRSMRPARRASRLLTSKTTEARRVHAQNREDYCSPARCRPPESLPLLRLLPFPTASGFARENR